VRERGPGIVDTAQEGDRDDDYAEDEAYLLRFDAGADGEAKRASGEAGESDDKDEEGPAADVRCGVRRRDIVRQRIHDAGCDDALYGGEADLFNGDEWYG